MSKKPISEIERGAGYFAGLVTGLLDATRELAVPFEAIYRLTKPEGRSTLLLMVGLANTAYLESISPAEPVAKPVQTFTCTVDHDDPAYRTMPKQGGDWYYVDTSLTTAHFPITRKGIEEVTYEYVEFDHEPTTQEVLNEIKRRGLERPDYAETMAFLKEHPNERKVAPVISLCGLVGDRLVADVDARGFGLRLLWDDLSSRWGQRCRFLAVRRKAA